MLDYIRSNTQSFGLKLAFGVIILVFVFWGVGNFTEGDSSRVMAKVNGEPILETQFYKRFQLIENQLMNQGQSREQMKAQHLGRQVLQNMVVHVLVRQEAQRLGLEITPLELRLAIERNPLFLNSEGKLDKESYERGLRVLRISHAEFEEQMRDDLLYEKMLELAAGEVWIAPHEARNHYDFLFEKREIQYLYFPAKDFLNEVSLSEAEVKSYYEANHAEFTSPKKAKITYIVLDTSKLVDPKTIAESEAQKWYEQHKNDYLQKEAVRCAHILVPLNPKAEAKDKEEAKAKIAEIEARLKKGESFADLANIYNKPGAAEKDGELGWIEPGVTVEPFEKAAFAQKVGEVSKPVETQFGLHLILVHEKRPEKIREFSEVKAELLATLAKEMARDKMNEVGESLLEDNLLGKNLEESAQKFNLKALQTDFLSAEELVAKLHLSPEDAAMILLGTPVDTLLQAGDEALIVRINEVKPELLQPLDQVEAQIKTKLQLQKAEDLALKKAEAALKEVQDTTKANSYTLKTANLERNGQVEGFKVNQALAKATFAADAKTWLKSAFKVTKNEGEMGAMLVYLQAITPASSEDWERLHTFLENGLARETGDQVRNIFLQELFRKAKITNVDMEKADRIGI